MKLFLDKIVEESKLNVVGECSHQLKIIIPMVLQCYIYRQGAMPSDDNDV